MFTLWEIRAGGDGGGRELFGKDYTDIWAITNLHFSAESRGMCDHVRFHISRVKLVHKGGLLAIINALRLDGIEKNSI